MNTNPVVWFEIYVQDMARAQKFYGWGPNSTRKNGDW